MSKSDALSAASGERSVTEAARLIDIQCPEGIASASSLLHFAGLIPGHSGGLRSDVRPNRSGAAVTVLATSLCVPTRQLSTPPGLYAIGRSPRCTG